MAEYQGDCLCGDIRYEVSGDTDLISINYSFTNESCSGWQTEFCSRCASTLFMQLDKRPGLTAISYGTFDPPTFHFPVTREVFTRSKAHFVGEIEAAEHHETIFGYDQCVQRTQGFQGMLIKQKFSSARYF